MPRIDRAITEWTINPSSFDNAIQECKSDLVDRIANASFSLTFKLDNPEAWLRFMESLGYPVTRFVWNGERYIRAGG